ncbi:MULTISPECIES: nicotinate-nucleotide--dimethylbenzimidazole phosphoribosyltransferase [Rhodomicrobium]|uniref:nicotinate-nucleotide--dimethylbenzimidazole phosphoribosyltransferase n=1 Tax=Rhodomicrobium TaxID=1068 RepID=UPI000B4A60C2|nr:MULTISPECIES: nicotinate-nucleotide--dimethylbenzimidazole phosphoribosyltransferase [Rhodomicrobium]
MYPSLAAFSDALHDLPPANEAWRETARRRQTELTKPAGSLGRLEEIAVFLAGWGEAPEPRAASARVIVFAGNHGVTERGVSPYPADVTEQMIANFARGGAAINAIAKACAVEFSVVPLALERPTGDISRGPAMSEAELLEALNAGADAVRGRADILAFGEMGIGNTTIAAALAARSLGGTGADWAGPGTGLSSEGVLHKAAVIDEALALHAATGLDALEIMRHFGGRETAAIAGAVVAARHALIPVVLDGYVMTASLAPLFRQNPAILAHCLAGHRSAEPAHIRLLQALGLPPLIDLGMRLGEGTGATLAIALIRAAAAAHNEMATFAEARVANRDHVAS